MVVSIMLHDYEPINRIEVTFPATAGSNVDLVREYRTQSELLNWSTQLRERKIELSEIRTQANNIRRLEIRETGDLLKQENVLTKLLGEKNYLF